MTAIDTETLKDAAREARRARTFARITKLDGWFKLIGFAWMTPILR
ncbi:ABC transporter permease, partial [Thioclava sp. BHET1]